MIMIIIIIMLLLLLLILIIMIIIATIYMAAAGLLPATKTWLSRSNNNIIPAGEKTENKKNTNLLIVKYKT